MFMQASTVLRRRIWKLLNVARTTLHLTLMWSSDQAYSHTLTLDQTEQACDIRFVAVSITPEKSNNDRLQVSSNLCTSNILTFKKKGRGGGGLCSFYIFALRIDSSPFHKKKAICVRQVRETFKKSNIHFHNVRKIIFPDNTKQNKNPNKQ